MAVTLRWAACLSISGVDWGKVQLLALLNSRESTISHSPLMSQSSDSNGAHPGSAANSAVNSASNSLHNSRQGSPVPEEEGLSADASPSYDQKPKHGAEEPISDDIGSDLNIDVDENGEIDLDALFAGEIPNDLDQAPNAPSEQASNDQKPASENQKADDNSESNNGAQNGAQNSAQNDTPSGAADDVDMIFNAPPDEPLLNDPNNDPLLNMELPLDSGVSLGQEPVFQSKEEAERERMKLLVSHFDEQQMSRYAAYRRANIRRASVKKFTSQLLNQPISNSVATVLGGMSKVLIGDVIELARDLQDKEEQAERRRRNLPDPQPGAEPEPLLPSYVREAWTIYKRDTGTVPGSKTKLGSMNRTF